MFGLSFGINKSKNKTTTDQTQTTNQTQNDTKTSTGTTTGTSATQTSQAGTTAQQGTTASQAVGTETSQVKTQQFSDQVLGGLESVVGQLFGGVGAANKDMTRTSDFNANDFIAAGMDAASTRVNEDLNTNLNSMYDDFGGRDDSNSMVALLGNRMRTDAGASLAGTRGQLGAQAEGILRENQAANVAAQGGQQNFMANLLGSLTGALKGGVSTTEGATQTAQATAGQNQSTGQTTQTGSENTQTAQTQQLAEALSSIINGTQHVTGTTKSKGLNIGGGASASF